LSPAASSVEQALSAAAAASTHTRFRVRMAPSGAVALAAINMRTSLPPQFVRRAKAQRACQRLGEHFRAEGAINEQIVRIVSVKRAHSRQVRTYYAKA
jgi:hypothetical protein